MPPTSIRLYSKKIAGADFVLFRQIGVSFDRPEYLGNRPGSGYSEESISHAGDLAPMKGLI